MTKKKKKGREGFVREKRIKWAKWRTKNGVPKKGQYGGFRAGVSS
jgi:hypothetical protein